jgi:hypothetical protein
MYFVTVFSGVQAATFCPRNSYVMCTACYTKERFIYYVMCTACYTKERFIYEICLAEVEKFVLNCSPLGESSSYFGVTAKIGK